jgi:hypothetical protein
VYIDLKADTSDALNVEAAKLRISKKQLLQRIVEEYFNKEKVSGKTKK